MTIGSVLFTLVVAIIVVWSEWSYRQKRLIFKIAQRSWARKLYRLLMTILLLMTLVYVLSNVVKAINWYLWGT